MLYHVRNIKQLQGYRGFTLIEMMIVVAIIGIIMAFGIPSWKESTRKGDRKEAEAALSNAAQYMERYYSAHSTFAAITTPSTATPTPFTGVPTSKYTFSLTSTATTYTLTATPSATDSYCGTLTLDQKGARTASGSKGVSYCW